MLLQSVCVLLTVVSANAGDNPHLAFENTACDLKARNESCVPGFCCVRDEFLYTETLCRALGKAGDACATKLTEFECPCEDGFRCASNIHGHVTSLFGKCYPIPQPTDQTANSMTTQMPDSHVTTESPTRVTKASKSHVTMDSTITHNLVTTVENVKHVQLDGDTVIG
ncbi:uncharacterized protein LOC132760495 [Ruditapes philippinarum]|uniref:uncharacterized protein LOC132760495 n=1 Tax=Ruditapes philippinarum TaxID=129788 RepID=UPI00295BC0C3|nr:uncharacterized protein LOC132760495 [Ruditapes philippinarum]